MGGVADNSGDALVVEPNGDSARGDKDCYAIACHQRSGVVHFNAPPANHFNRERTKWRPAGKRFNQLLESVRCHHHMLSPVTIICHLGVM